MRLKRRTVLSGLVGLSLPLIASSCARNEARSSSAATETTAPAQTGTIRIGYQKATDLDLLRTRGELDIALQPLRDRHLQAQGAKAEWSPVRG